MALWSPSSGQPGAERGDAMTSTLRALLCLGLSVGLRTTVQADVSLSLPTWTPSSGAHPRPSPSYWELSSDPGTGFLPGTLPKPIIWTEPGSVIPAGSPVTIWCQAAMEVKEFCLDKERSPEPWERKSPRRPGDKAKFRVAHMTQHYAGVYSCHYHSPAGWSEHSDPLELLVSGRLPDRPSLSVQPGPRVASGENVTLLCQSRSLRDTFLLSKEGAADTPLHLRSKHRAQQSQAEFSMSPVTSTNGGTYRCYSSHSSSPYLLSLPSEPLELLVSGDPVNITPSVQTPNSTSGPQGPDYTVENLIAMSLSGLILVVLGVLVFQAWYSERRSPGIN